VLTRIRTDKATYALAVFLMPWLLWEQEMSMPLMPDCHSGPRLAVTDSRGGLRRWRMESPRPETGGLIVMTPHGRIPEGICRTVCQNVNVLVVLPLHPQASGKILAQEVSEWNHGAKLMPKRLRHLLFRNY